MFLVISHGVQIEFGIKLFEIFSVIKNFAE